MKCGICHNATPTYEYRGFGSLQPTRTLPVRDAGDLAQHKRQQHPAEFQAAIEKREAGKQAVERARIERAAKVRDVGQQHGRLALLRYDESSTPILTHTSEEYSGVYLRYPNKTAFAEYQRLTEAAKTALETAWRLGSRVPQEDIDAVKRTMEEARREEAKHDA